MKALKTLAVAVIAGSAIAGNIAILDSKTIITNSNAYKQIANLADTNTFKTQRQKVQDLRAKYTSAVEKLTQEKLTKNTTEYKTQETKVDTLRTEYTTAQRTYLKALTTAQNTKAKELFDKFKVLVETYARKHNIDMVLNNQVVIATGKGSKVDITADIQKLFTETS